MSSIEDSTKRVETLRKKIAALESLASNPSTTSAESESAQGAANKLRLELSKRLREDSKEKSEVPVPPAAPEVDPKAAEAKPEPDPRPRTMPPRRPAAANQTAHGQVQFSARAPKSATVSPWIWLLAAVVSAAAVALAMRVPVASQARTVASASDVPSAAAERDRGAAAAELRACETRRVFMEFQASAGASPRAGEEHVDVRRRCGTYLTVRGFDDAVCFPETADNPHPACPQLK